MKATALVCVALVLAITSIALALIRYAHGAERMLCHLEPLAEGWHYRTKIAPLTDVRCWYDGPRMLPRSQLYWAESPAVPMLINECTSSRSAARRRQPSQSCPNHTTPGADDEIWNLIDRWRGEYQRGGAAPGWQHKE